jgi:hypothetical protein
MKSKLSTLGLAVVLCGGLVSFMGCGPKPPDTSTVKTQTPEDTTKQIEDAMKSGKINPATYGKSYTP